MTEKAVAKVLEVMNQQNPKLAGLRVGVIGGGCSGFSYNMEFTDGKPVKEGTPDKIFEFGELKVYVDQVSLMYLEGTEINYVEGLQGSGFTFRNPNTKSTCGCGSSFST